MNKKTWAAISIISLGVFYFNLLWKTTGNVDSLTTDLLFYSAICGLLWQRKDSLAFNSDLISSFIGLSLLTALLIKSITLFSFEATLIPLIPFFAAISLALITSGIRGIRQYKQEIFFAWFLFFPPGVIGHLIDRFIPITVLNAKLATYLLYYVGFDASNQGNNVILNLPKLGQFQAIVNYPCAGVPMILLILKLSLLLICFYSFSKQQKIIIPSVSILIGFVLGSIRVCILTLLIPEPTKFDYWHGNNGSQIFSTLAILIFSVFIYWIQTTKDLSSKNQSSNVISQLESSKVSRHI
jgi:cyanoexosortase A